MAKGGARTRNRHVSPAPESPIDSPTIQSPPRGASQPVRHTRGQSSTYYVP
ncbi:unnamed protein product [Arabis nemorensis]|uniref:Uncharacterized protein n=1 Tax=Arabis nemorensis TaxID=586526 RepID=A0A565CBN3_9BRAS|nr:unnamed protein product [Arabis nemorensis]